MMRSNFRVILLTVNICDFFMYILGIYMKENINVRVKESIAKKMMICFMFNTDTLEVAAAPEVVENIDSRLVVCVDIGVSTDKY